VAFGGEAGAGSRAPETAVRLRHRALGPVARPDRTAWYSLGLVAAFLPVAALVILPLALGLRGTLAVPLRVSYGVWCASAVCYALRPVQLALARLLWPIRRPTPAERRRLDLAWEHVVDHARVPGQRFRIKVVDLAEVNAHSVGRDLICVTTGALTELGDRELAGVLAHELGHHLRMHTSAAAFLVWVLLPLQAVAMVGALLSVAPATLAHTLADRAPRDSSAEGLSIALIRLSSAIRRTFAAPGLVAFAAKNAAGRCAEYQVDAFAVDVGLGVELLSALRWFAAHGMPLGTEPAAIPAARVSADGRARHAAARIPKPTHPPLDRRMARIAARVELGRAACGPGGADRAP
jgi:Zn-dependent protease with chaperone function